MTSDGILAKEVTTSSVNGDCFFDFVRGSLIPMMKPFDGHSPNSVLILDNCFVHNISEVTQLQTQAGIVVLF